VVLQRIAVRHNAATRQIALSWLLHHSDNILLIPGTSNIDHLEENMAAGDIQLSDEEMRELDAIAG
jgi:aryl-alcohol dehydrogenase-like predicted oxidoreductase